MNIIVGNAWPYANGSLHLGRLAIWLPGDVIARYHRLMGDNVIFLSGTDCHGTPVTIKAKEEGLTPLETVDKYHKEFKRIFEKLGFSFDIFEKTHTEYHEEKVKQFILDLYNKGFIYEENVEQAFCSGCNEVISDRYIEGKCPKCNSEALGDECEECSEIFDAVELKEKRCKVCKTEPTMQTTKHLFFKLSAFEEAIRELYLEQEGWRGNALKILKRYIDEGLRDKAVTRDFNWGIDVPLEGYEDKKIYVWIEAVMGYLTATMKYCENANENWEEYWKDEESRVYFVHGKDNIPFHTVILPSILIGLDIPVQNLRVISSEYLKLEGKPFSAVKNWAIWGDYIFKNYNVDSFRYYLLLNSPEEKDSDFTWKEYINVHNNDLVNVFTRFINKVSIFIKRVYGGRIPVANLDENIKDEILDLYFEVGDKIEIGEFTESLKTITNYCKKVNKNLDEVDLWSLLEKNPMKCRTELYNYIQIVINLANLLEPFIPEACKKIRESFNINEAIWSFLEKKQGVVKEVPILFTKIDNKKSIYEFDRLKQKKL